MAKVKKDEVQVLVKDLVNEFSASDNKRFKAKELQMLFYAVLTDETHVAKKVVHDMKKLEKRVEEVNYAKQIKKFIETLFVSQGMKPEEAAKAADEYKIKSKDIAVFGEAWEEAQVQYFETGKAVKIWANNSLELLIKKYQRTGKYEGKTGYQRKVIDKDEKLAARKAKK